jgi:hypothetical protein
MVHVSGAFSSGRGTLVGPVAITRRVALVIPVLALAACSTDSTTPSGADASTDQSIGLASVANELDLIAQYDAAIAQFPQLATTLSPLRDQHRAHLSALGTPEVTGSSSPLGTRPASPQAALTQLAGAEKQAALQRLSDCLIATDEDVARTLALISASEASHVAVLVGS